VENITINVPEKQRGRIMGSGAAGMVVTQIGGVEQMMDYENKRGIEGGGTYGKVDASSYER
jgi:hypothetical protein